jgi:CpcD/allophycocyanin linker domain
MATIASNIGDISTFGNRMVTITVTKMNQRAMHSAHQQMSVAYSRLSQTMQSIHRNGGKVVAVSLGGATQSAPAASAAPAKQPETSSKKNKK